MGAIDAFTKTFSIVLANKRLYLLVLAMALILALLSVYLIPSDFEYTYNQTSIQNGDVIVEEYGTPITEDEMDMLMEVLKGLMIYLIITIVLSSIVEYGITKGIFTYLNDEDYSLGELLADGLKHFPGVLVINIIYSLIMLVFIGVAAIPMVVGALFLPAGAVLILIGVVLLFLVLAFTLGLSSMAIPLYADKGTIGAAFEAFGLAFRNVLSTIGFGALLGVAAIGIAIIASPLAFIIQITLPENLAPYVSAFVQAPFDALLYFFLWAGGVAFYRELQRMEELKKVDEELAELGIEI
ncbi:hypothetical protein E3E26_05175 [Thermococcus sp. LS1]|uniref:hypothetical protein n=1 Tax=Thermococcus sp. LS1 TaxID=1638259 RepID=UPI00143A7880|nr:hypothetical protein [Thermococcus sp. LS1]NJD99172.1 hypothetical protein [Thermococcus sp. LS1]